MAIRQYIGARYVPKFYENSDNTAEWRAGVIYEPLTIVTYNGNSYTSKKTVPAEIGNPSANQSYWVATGIFNEQLAELMPLLTEAVRSFNTVANMVAASPDNGAVVYCQRYYSGSGEGFYCYVDTTSDAFSISVGGGKYAHPVINKKNVFVSQFGAVGDAITDDTDAVQKAIDYAGNSGVVILDRASCKISNTINIPYSNFSLRGGDSPEYQNCLYVPQGENVSPMLNVSGKIFSMYGVALLKQITTRDERSGVGLVIKAASPDTDANWFNMDAYICKSYMMGLQTGADCYGRNIIFGEDCHFSNCNTGVWYHSANGNQETVQRGWIVENCRFHSIGSAITTQTVPDDTNDVAVRTDVNAQTQEIIIRNNVFDGGCVCFMYKGVSDGLIIDGNLVEAGNRVVFGLVKRSIVNNNIFAHIRNNVINTGSSSGGIFSDTLVHISGARVFMCNNHVRCSMAHIMKFSPRDTGITSYSGVVIQGNNFLINQSNTELIAVEDATAQIAVIGNTFGVVSGATGITFRPTSGVGYLNSANKDDCNTVESGITLN